MSKVSVYTCSSCGHTEQKWFGKCTSCGSWGTMDQTTKKRTTGVFDTKTKKTGERDIFDQIWKEREHKSFLSGELLDKWNNPTFYANLFAHVLPKGQFQAARLDKENIILLTPEEHMLLDHGTREQRKKYAEENLVDWSRIFVLRDQLKQKYGKG